MRCLAYFLCAVFLLYTRFAVKASKHYLTMSFAGKHTILVTRSSDVTYYTRDDESDWQMSAADADNKPKRSIVRRW